MKTKINRRDHLKTLKCILLLALLPASLASAQSIQIPNLCGTGRNPACNGLQQPIGSVDAHWNLATPYPTTPSGPFSLVPSTLVYGPAFVNTPNGSWLANGPVTQWITPQVTNSLGGNYVYETTFDIPSGYNPATATITGGWTSDNEGIVVWLNDTQLTGFPLPGPSGFSGPLISFTITQGSFGGATFQPGPNRLFFVLRNRGGGGFDANPTDTGLRVEFTGSAVLPFPPPTLGAYAPTTLLLSGDTIVAPTSAPLNTTSINVSTSTNLTNNLTNFKGVLEANPMTGVVHVTNAHPDGIYTVTVTAFDGPDVFTQTMFTLTVTTPPCRSSDQVGFARTNFPISTNPPITDPRSVVIGDFDGDGIQDLAISARINATPLSQGKVSILLGKGANFIGAGTFNNAVDFLNGTSTSNSTPNSLAVGDFNGDGRQDIATANSGSNNASVFLNNTTNGILDFMPVDYSVGPLPRSVAVGDFNGDHKQDLVVTNEFPIGNVFTISVLLGNGDGTFQPAINFPLDPGFSPYWVAVGDFNGDNMPDLAVTIRDPVNKVAIFLNNTPPNPPPGVVSFSSPISFPVGGDALSVAVGNFNGGSQDLVTASQIHTSFFGKVSVLLGVPPGSFPTVLDVPLPNPTTFSPNSAAVGDFNNDTKQDLVVATSVSNSNFGRVLVSLNDALGTAAFSPFKSFFVGTNPTSVAVGDFTGDGRQDLAVANFSSNNVSVMLRRPCPCGATFSENFDGVKPPALPMGWTAANAPPGPASPTWVTSNIDPDTVPNDAFVGAPATVSDKSLLTPGILISSASTQLSFRNNYCLENGFDGGVLEVSSPNINAGAFTDITDPAVGASFISGGYNATINPSFGSPIAGRLAWSGNSCCYICTVINLGPNVNGQTIRLRFRMASDSSVGGIGWRIDKVQVSDGNGACCSTGPAKTILGSVSTRLRVETGGNVGIGGFIIVGSEPKAVLLRAIGPSLTQLGVPDALVDPVLELHGPDPFATITNDNWRDTQEAEIQATSIPPTDNLESAIAATLAPGAYTAVVRGNGNASGVALIEVYDLDQSAPSTLANISTRASVGTGNNIMIAGFIVINGEFDRLVLRGIGPSLTDFGVPGALANPTLELRDSNGALLVANNDWQDDAAQAAELTAAGLAPTNNLESGIFATLPPGAYTVLLAGVNNGTGVGLVEVYDLDAVDSTITSATACAGGPVSPE
jgi:hypothetical protein